MSRRKARVLTFLLAAIAVASLPWSPARAGPPRTVGDSAVVADVPAPRFPEGIAVNGHTMYVSSPAQNGRKGPAYVFAFDIRDGSRVRDYVIPAKDEISDHGLVGVALDGSGHLYVADIQRRIVRVDLVTEATSDYATIPDLHPCPLFNPCSPALIDRPPFPNDIAFDGAGNAYVTDMFQATIWRIPAGGGQAVPWFQHAALDKPLGPNGIRLTPGGNRLCFAVSGPPGAIYCLPVTDQPKPGDLQLFHEFPGDGPDNLAFGESGKLYVALAFANQIAVLRPDGTEEVRFSGPAQDGNRWVRWDAPAGVAFDNSSRSLLVTNHALVAGLVDESLFVVFDVYVNDVGYPLERPKL
jgi:hypothetical protein